MGMPRSKRDTRSPWMDAARPRSLPRGILPLHLIVLEDILLFIIQDIVLIVLVHILHRGIQCEDVVLLLVVEGSWKDRVCCPRIHVGESSRRVKGLVDRRHEMTQAKVLREKGVSDLP